jgi:uncharacterized membrane protein YbaN (DUF454 family)
MNDLLAGRGLSRTVKAGAITLLWTMMAAGAWHAPTTILRVVMLGVAVAVTIHLLLLPVRPR